MNISLRFILLLLLLFVLSGFVYAQGEIEFEREPDNYNENSFGAKLNSNGWGLDYRFSQRITYRSRYFYEAGFDYVKDAKEIKVINPYFNQQRKFVFGKIHSFQTIKAGMGYNRLLVEKRDRGSIAINANFSAGGILGIAKPIYYELVDSTKVVGDIQYYYTNIHRLDIHKYNPTDVVGKASFFDGLSETKFIPGIFVKAALNFDFSRNVMKSNLIETGINCDFYFNEVEIMAENPKSLFLSIYVSYRFGSKYNANLSREARNEN